MTQAEWRSTLVRLVLPLLASLNVSRRSLFSAAASAMQADDYLAGLDVDGEVAHAHAPSDRLVLGQIQRDQQVVNTVGTQGWPVARTGQATAHGAVVPAAARPP